MSSRIKRQAPLLKLLSKAKPATVRAVIKEADKDLVDALCECALNVLSGTVSLSKPARKKLLRHKSTLRCLSGKSLSTHRKKVLLQKGGFLGALLGPVLGILGNVLGSV